MKNVKTCQDMIKSWSWVILSDPESVAGPSRGRSCSWRSRSRGTIRSIRSIRSEPLPAGSACCFLKLCKIWNEHEMNMKWTWNEHDWHDSCSFPKDIESIKMKLWERCQGELEFGSEQTETWIFCWATENKILTKNNQFNQSYWNVDENCALQNFCEALDPVPIALQRLWNIQKRRP